jgi:hypothetical protein
MMPTTSNPESPDLGFPLKNWMRRRERRNDASSKVTAPTCAAVVGPDESKPGFRRPSRSQIQAGQPTRSSITVDRQTSRSFPLERQGLAEATAKKTAAGDRR